MTDSKDIGHWDAAALAALPREHGFRLRGLDTTRLDTFIDAAFAFALTLLVISFDAIPESLDEMIQAVKRIPAFAMSSALVMLFWLNHRTWSRRYGMENAISLLLSIALIFVTLVWVYPLKSVFEGMFAALSDGWLPIGFEVNSTEDLRVLFLFYSSGFCAMSGLMWALFHTALAARDRLGLDALECRRTRTSRATWSVAAVVGAASIAVALFADGGWVTLAGWIYWALPLVMLVVSVRGARAARMETS